MQSKPERNVSKGVGPRDSRPFSSFDDLAQWAVSRGEGSSVSDVRENRLDIWGDLLFEWYTQGQIACVFAQSLARNPEKAKWLSYAVQGPLEADSVTAIVDASLTADAEGLQLLFPGPNTVEQAIDIVRTLGAHSRWGIVDNGWLDGEAGDSVQIGLRWIDPTNTYESWALGIAAFEPMPFTRKFVNAPFIALVLRSTPPMPDRAAVPKGEGGLDASHLAHMDDGLAADSKKRDKWTEGTRKAKRALVSPDPLSRARARVTFAFPAWARTELEDLLAR